MNIILLRIIVIVLCLIPSIFGILLIISGIRIERGKSSLFEVRESVWEKLFYEHHLRKKLHPKDESFSDGKDQIFFGIFCIILGGGFFLFLLNSRFLF